MMSDQATDNNAEVTEITLGDEHTRDDSEITLKEVNYEYIQKSRLRGITRSFLIFDDIHMYVSTKNTNPKTFSINLFRERSAGRQRVNLTYIDPSPDRDVHIAWEWFFNGLSAIAWSFVIIYIGEYTNFWLSHDVMLPIGVLLGTFGVVSFLTFWYKTQDKVVYKSYIGKVPLIEMFHLPRSKEYNAFVDELEQRIYKAYHRNDITMKHRLVGELKDLRRFKEAGLISDEYYESARTKIFKHREYKV